MRSSSLTPQELQFLLLSAKEDDSDSQLKLHYHYLSETTYNLTESQKWLLSAVKNKHPAAINALGYYHAQGLHGFAKSPELALKYYQLAADLGFNDAFYNLGVCFHHGLCGAKENHSYALHFYIAAAKRNLSEASSLLKTILEAHGLNNGFIDALINNYIIKAIKNSAPISPLIFDFLGLEHPILDEKETAPKTTPISIIEDLIIIFVYGLSYRFMQPLVPDDAILKAILSHPKYEQYQLKLIRLLLDYFQEDTSPKFSLHALTLLKTNLFDQFSQAGTLFLKQEDVLAVCQEWGKRYQPLTHTNGIEEAPPLMQTGHS